ncbi:MAG: TonB family protein [Desulfobacteraceae bacterium]|jgi:TonB family protein
MENKILMTTVFVSLAILGCAVNQHEQKQSKLKRSFNTASAVDKYLIEVAYEVNKNWAFVGDKNSETSKKTSITFKIMPNGEIKDLFFVKRSGNEALDQSAFNAILNTNPTKPFPANIKKPFIEMGLRFSPAGVR